MKQYLIVIVVSFLLTLPNILHAASIHNSNSKAYLIKEKNVGESWINVSISSRGTRYFRCRYGCEIVVIETGSTIVLESDEDVVISNGELRTR